MMKSDNFALYVINYSASDGVFWVESMRASYRICSDGRTAKIAFKSALVKKNRIIIIGPKFYFEYGRQCLKWLHWKMDLITPVATIHTTKKLLHTILLLLSCIVSSSSSSSLLLFLLLSFIILIISI